jgi:predicted MPP superfamily phosphohydrolase
MISKRYYLTILSSIPILLAQVFLARRALRQMAASRRGFHLWQAAVITGAILFSAITFTEFNDTVRIPRVLAATAQAILNLYGLVSVAAVAIFIVLERASRQLPGSFRQDRRNTLRVLASTAVAAPIAAAGFGVFIERTNFEVCETTIGVRNLPQELNGLRLLQISDIHLGPFLSVRTLAKVIDSANELKPHMAFVTGDLITAKGDPLDACLSQLARLRADVPTLGCLGNHEVYAEAVDYTTSKGARMGIEFLRNRAKKIQIRGGALNVVGVDYEPFERRPKYLRQAGSLIQPGGVNVLLSHNPDVFPVAAAQGYDLTLAGHMHGGQVTCEILSPALNPARILTPYVRGLYRNGDRACYVTRGIGTLGVPARLGARPEVTLLTLRQL